MACTSPLLSQHPRLLLTTEGVQKILAGWEDAPLFTAEVRKIQEELDKEMYLGLDVPIPKDMAGGYTHERHKKNWFLLQKAGVLFQLTKEEKYAQYARDMLIKYAEIYPDLPVHPTNRSYATGKIFWQCLNDANWLVYVSQAYDCIYDWLRPEDRELLENDLFRPFADFLSIENPRFFNRIHNHSTWANAAVGMIGLVMDDQELIDRALYGLKDDLIPSDVRDNDGGFIKQPGQIQAGFLAQLDGSFSPDGYFTEGPYYLRYAIFPFLLFSKSLANNIPNLDILNYRDAILKKAVYAMLYQTDARGQFFPINDAQKGMSWMAREAVTAVDMAYQHYGKDPSLLSIAQKQGRVDLNEAGFEVARDIQKDLAIPFAHKSIKYTDGPDGLQGGVGILRSSSKPGEEMAVVMKYSAQGMGHGHFDKLSYSLYDEKGEILQDYGAARWVNIDQKGGGRYLRENRTWAKQSIAHNCLVVNETSHYQGDIRIGEMHHPEPYLFDGGVQCLQLVSAKDLNAYEGITMHRTMVLFKDTLFQRPLVIDIMRTEAEEPNQYDLPIWFQGHVLSTGLTNSTEPGFMTPLGKDHGYQHLWQVSTAQPEKDLVQITWFSNGRFYTSTSVAEQGDEFIFARLGAKDPNFNLRPDQTFIHRKKKTEDALFVSILESHGDYDYTTEIPQHPFGVIRGLEVLFNDQEYTIIRFKDQTNHSWSFMLSNQQTSLVLTHKITIGEESFSWKGPFSLIQDK